ncbi:MAG: O-antigen ligase family protein [Actinomycetota bacterium]|nr:O-antigen ligase family protein [Actinomycetota bacterium]
MSTLIARDTTRRRTWSSISRALPFLLVALGAGAAVAITGELSIQYQLAAVLALAVLPSLAVLYTTKPHVVINGYIFLIPLLVSGPPGATTGADTPSTINPGIIATVLIIGIGLPMMLLDPRPVPRRLRSVVWPLIALGSLGLLSVLVNSATSLGDISNAVVKYFMFGVAALLVYRYNDTEPKVRSLMRALLLGGAVVAVYAIALFVLGKSYYPQYGYSRAAGTFENWNELGGYMSLIAFPMAMFGLANRRSGVRFVVLCATGLTLIALLLSLTLGSVLGVVVGSFVGAVIFFRKRLGRVIAVAILAGIVGAAVWHLVPAVSQKFAATNSRVEGRVAGYLVGLEAFKSNMLIGVGGESQVLQAVLATTDPGQRRVTVVPHNAFLAIGVEKGIFGSILLLVLVVNALRLLGRWQGGDDPEFRLWHYGILLGMIAFLVQNMSNLLILHSRLGVLVVAMLALDMRLQHLSKHATPSRADLASHK